MSQARGAQTSTIMWDEADYGVTPGTPDAVLLYLVRNTLQSNQNLTRSNVLSSGRERQKPGLGNINAGGDFELELGAESIGKVLKHAMGQVATSGAGPYTHTLTLGDLPVGFGTEKDFGAAITGNRYEPFLGCRVGSLALDFPAEGYPSARASIVGIDSALAATPTDATPTDTGHTSFTAFEATIEEGGSAIAYVESASISIDNELDGSVYCIGGAGKRRSLPEGFATVTGSITALFESDALLTKAGNGTESNLKLTLSRGDGLGSTGNESIEFFVQQLRYGRTSPPIEGPQGLKVTLPFEAYISGANSALQVTLKNAVASL